MEPLSRILNSSIPQGIFPNTIKADLFSSIFKKEDKLNVKNYIPISLLSNVMKLF